MNTDRKIKLLSVLCLFTVLASLSAKAAIKKGTLACGGCTVSQMKVIAINAAGNSDARYLMSDRSNSKIYEVTVESPNYNGSHEDEEAQAVATVSVNLAASAAFEQLIYLSDEIAVKSQVEVTLPGDFVYQSVFEVLLSGATTADFQSILQDSFSSGLVASLNEISRRADNQLQLLDSSLSVDFKGMGFELGSVIKESSWVVKFPDGTSLVVNISFLVVNDKLVVIVAPLQTLAKDKNGNRIPLARFSVNGTNVSGEQSTYIDNMANYYNSLGIFIERHNIYAGWDVSRSCVSAGMTCTADKCIIKYVCTN